MWKKLLMIYLIFGISLAILIALSLYSYQRFNAYLAYAESVDRNQNVLQLLNKLQTQMLEIESNQRAYLLYSDTIFYQQFQTAQTSLKHTFKTLFDILSSEEEQHRKLRYLNFAIRSELDYLQTGITAGKDALDYRKGKSHMEKCYALIAEIEEKEKEFLNEKQQTRQFYEETTPKNFRLLFVFTLAIFIISFFMLFLQYRERLRYQRKLEDNILELNQANSEWEQISYVASHDLQEPLRKLRTFSDLLNKRYHDQLDEDGKSLVQRIDIASARAQELMQDIVNYNMVVSTEEEMYAVDLDRTLSDVLSEMRQSLSTQQGSVHHDGLPVVRGYPSQLSLLFRCMIENSLKFKKENEPVKMMISSSVVQASHVPSEHALPYDSYHRIVFEDNGIGFDNRFGEKIFRIFQRLHPQDSAYQGRGIGLSMVKRIITNHGGYIVARGKPGVGAGFTMYFPVR